mmetsp:Transcript_18173/g.25674  ORF Transcript_18173/g.25674 Transcript_18173/m.25674 type:complete len:198 (+) Transcript_18173:4547-5140(+)
MSGLQVRFTSHRPIVSPTKEYRSQIVEHWIRDTNSSNRWILNDIDHPSSYEYILQLLRSHSLYLVSDGSFNPTNGNAAAAWVMGGVNQRQWVTGSCFCLGDTSTQTPYRAESAGLQVGLLHLYAIIKVHNIQGGGLHLGCDGKGAVDRINSGAVSTSSPNFDYSILYLIRTIPCNVRLSHVLGHQDTKNQSKQLTLA